MIRAGTALAWILLLCGVVASSRADETPFAGMAEVMTNQLGVLSRVQPRGASQPVTLYFRDDAVRFEFKDNTGAQYALILTRGAATGWIMGAQGSAMPVPGMRWPLRFDPHQPCTGLGMFADCQAGEIGMRAGKQAQQWRYRLSTGVGPGNTRQGTMWLDESTGLVLAYTGKAGLEQQQRWEVQSVTYGPQPDALFEVPQGKP